MKFLSIFFTVAAGLGGLFAIGYGLAWVARHAPAWVFVACFIGLIALFAAALECSPRNC